MVLSFRINTLSAFLWPLARYFTTSTWSQKKQNPACYRYEANVYSRVLYFVLGNKGQAIFSKRDNREVKRKDSCNEFPYIFAWAFGEWGAPFTSRSWSLSGPLLFILLECRLLRAGNHAPVRVFSLRLRDMKALLKLRVYYVIIIITRVLKIYAPTFTLMWKFKILASSWTALNRF